MWLTITKKELPMSDKKESLYPAQVAAIAECHPNTVKRYERRGVIRSKRDVNNFRRYSMQEALKLKKLLAKRVEIV
jgi:DNA-binding transcriptional MerR regulator